MTLYQQITTGSALTESKPPEQENALLAQQRINWLTSAGTKLLFRNIADEITQLQLQARQIANEYHVNQNHLRIIQLLQQSNTLQKLIDTYGKMK